MSITDITTKDGKTLADFILPQGLLEKDAELVELILRSEAMDDAERQYWFNLTDVMTPEQVEKLRDILTRERQKLAEIYKKYGKEMPMSEGEIAAQVQEKAEDRKKAQAELRAKEAMAEAQERASQEGLLDDGAWS